MRQRIQTLFLITTALFVSCLAIADESQSQLAPIIPSGKKLGTIFNNDINNILLQAGLKGGQVADYQRYLDQLLAIKPKVLAQNVGLPDPVIYRSDVATTFDKYVVEISKVAWPENNPEKDSIPQEKCLLNLFAAGTDPLKLTIDACRRNGVLIVASYRMNAEDWYQHTWQLSDFGRDHPDYRIPAQKDTPGWGKPLTGNLDPAIPEVYEHRMKIFREVAEKYDIDGIEFDFRRWYHMVSDPEKNHVVLTRMVRDTRAMLDEIAKRKGRNKLLLGVRVAPSLEREANTFLYPGAFEHKPPDGLLENSCRYYGLDVQTWVKEGLVDYICPSQFLGQLPGLPMTREFADLTQGTDIGVYPTLWSLASWMHDILGVERDITLEPKDRQALALYKYDLCNTALQMYRDGADGISTFNWYAHLVDPDSTWPAGGAGAVAVQKYVLPFLNDPAAIRNYLDQPWATPSDKVESTAPVEDSKKCAAQKLILSAPLTHADWLMRDGTPAGPEGVRYMIDTCKATGWSRIYWRVLDGGLAMYQSKLLEPDVGKKIMERDSFYNAQSEADKRLIASYGITQANIDDARAKAGRIDYSVFDPLAEAVRYGHEIGLEVHAWISINEDDHAWGAESRYSLAHPESRWVKRDGTVYHSQQSFAFPEVRAYKLAIVKEILDNYKVDGIFLDWIRTGDVRDNPQSDTDGVADFGYEKPLVESFKAKFGVNPHELPNGDPRWVAWRAQPQTEFMTMVRKMMKAQCPTLPLAVMVHNRWGYRGNKNKIDDNLRGMLLDVETWAKEGLMDSAVAAGYYLEGGNAEKAYQHLKRQVGDGVDVWLFGWVPVEVKDFENDRDLAEKLGAKQILFWEADYIDGREKKELQAAMRPYLQTK